MKKERQYLTITLPPHLAELPIQIKRGTNCSELICNVHSIDNNVHYIENIENKFVFVWRNNQYIKLTLNDIIWIEANGSYCTLNLLDNKTMVISSPLARIEEVLPDSYFTRIHRSHIINLKHITHLIGNSIQTNGKLLTIGREYRDSILDRFIFLGIRRKHKKI